MADFNVTRPLSKIGETILARRPCHNFSKRLYCNWRKGESLGNMYFVVQSFGSTICIYDNCKNMWVVLAGHPDTRVRGHLQIIRDTMRVSGLSLDEINTVSTRHMTEFIFENQIPGAIV